MTALKRREKNLKQRYGITLEQYEQLLVKQEGVCSICHRVPRTKPLAVDHDHKTGTVRGLLCLWCNRALEATVMAHERRTLEAAIQAHQNWVVKCTCPHCHYWYQEPPIL